MKRNRYSNRTLLKHYYKIPIAGTVNPLFYKKHLRLPTKYIWQRSTLVTVWF